jgi:hypothetical protein
MRLGWVILGSLACFAASLLLFINVGTSEGRIGGVVALVAGVALLAIAAMGHGSGRAARRRRGGQQEPRQPF